MASISKMNNMIPPPVLIVLSLILFNFLAQHGLAINGAATTWVVGDEKGWDFGVGDWPSGKNFTTGDILIFKYNVKAHNVVISNPKFFAGCDIIADSKIYESGLDLIKLIPGPNYFFCGRLGHCQKGMKIVVDAN